MASHRTTVARKVDLVVILISISKFRPLVIMKDLNENDAEHLTFYKSVTFWLLCQLLPNPALSARASKDEREVTVLGTRPVHLTESSL